MRETSLGHATVKMVSNTPEFWAERGRVDPQTLQSYDTRWHHSFSAGFFAREAAAFNEHNRIAAPAKMNGQRRTGDPGTRNQHVRRLIVPANLVPPACAQNNPGKKRDFLSIATR